MRSPTEIIVFATLFTFVMGAAHYYLWRRLVRDTQLPRALHLIISILLVILLLGQPATFLLMRYLAPEQLAPWPFITFTWLGLVSTLFWLLALGDLGIKLKSFISRKLAPNKQQTPNEAAQLSDLNASRRLALGRMLAGGVAFTGTALGSMATAQARELKLVPIEIWLPKLPAAFDGFKIVQMSDIHVGPTIGRDFIEKIVSLSNDQAPDLVALTGDLVDGSVQNLSRHTEPLKNLRAREGVYFVTGNHEYYSGADDWITELARLNIPTLRNQNVRLERSGQSLLLAGVTDYRAGKYDDAPDLVRALSGRRTDEEVILLAHQPRALAEAAEHDVGLQLSGHTHGGQFWPWNWVIHLIEPVVSGWAQVRKTQIYVSSGTGYWGPPMRMGTEAEITIVTLRAGSRV